MKSIENGKLGVLGPVPVCGDCGQRDDEPACLKYESAISPRRTTHPYLLMVIALAFVSLAVILFPGSRSGALAYLQTALCLSITLFLFLAAYQMRPRR